MATTESTTSVTTDEQSTGPTESTLTFEQLIDRDMKNLYKTAGKFKLDAKTKAKRVANQCTRIVTRIDAKLESKETGPEAPSKAQLYYWRGRALDADEAYSQEAENSLSRAVKLEPTMIEAWNTMANVYWKKADLAAAEGCLKNALKHGREPATLRMLSMVTKNMGEGKIRALNITQSITYAREAIGLDLKCGESWYVLGNALMADFFTNTQDRATLITALKAYAKAEQYHTGPANPDLYFNRGNLLKYIEDYKEAIESYTRAGEIDPGLPTANEVESLGRLVRKLARLCETKNGMRKKRVRDLCARMPHAVNMYGKQGLLLERMGVSHLSEGKNPSKFYVGIIVAPVARSSDTPVSFVCIDKGGNACVVSIYNVTQDVIDDVKVDQLLYVQAPILKQISLTSADGRAQSYPTVHVSSSATLLVDGVALTQSFISNAQLRAELKA